MKQALPILLLFICLSSYGQVPDDYTSFMADAGNESLLFRGRRAMDYNFLYNGTYFWHSPAFGKGDLRFNGKNYYGVMMNIDAASQNLLCAAEASILKSQPDRSLVEWFTIGDVRYINPSAYGFTGAPEGFFELLYDGRAKLLRQVTKHLMDDRDGSLRAETGYDGRYRSDVFRTFVRQVKYYYVDESGNVSLLKGRLDILKHYKPIKRAIKKHVNKVEGDNMLPLDSYFKLVMLFAEEGR